MRCIRILSKQHPKHKLCQKIALLDIIKHKTYYRTLPLDAANGLMEPRTLGKHHSKEEEGDLVSVAEVPLTEQETSNWPIEISSNADEQNPQTSTDIAQEEEEEEEEEVHHEDEPKSIIKRFAPWWVPQRKEHWFLTVLSLLESTNHISTLLFVAGSYQRVVLEEHNSICSGGAHLKPILPADCPEELLIGTLPSCNWELQDLALCEADYEYDMRLRFDQIDLGFAFFQNRFGSF